MEPTLAPARLNGAICAAVLFVNSLALFALPALLEISGWWTLLLLPCAAVSSTQWGLIHEAIHKILHPSLRVNDALGRVLAIFLGASFSILRFGHLMHHRLNRDWQSERHCGKLAYYWNLLAGVYISEAVSGMLMALLPRKPYLALANGTMLKHYPEVSVTGERFFYEQGNAKAVRTDSFLILLLYGAAFMAYGTHWPLLVLFIALRAFVISFLDNIYHYGTPADNSKAGKELALPAPLSFLLLNSNYHETHHLNPRMSWRALPRAHAAQQRRFDGGFIRHGLMQFEGPL